MPQCEEGEVARPATQRCNASGFKTSFLIVSDTGGPLLLTEGGPLCIPHLASDAAHHHDRVQSVSRPGATLTHKPSVRVGCHNPESSRPITSLPICAT